MKGRFIEYKKKSIKQIDLYEGAERFKNPCDRERFKDLKKINLRTLRPWIGNFPKELIGHLVSIPSSYIAR